MLIVNFVIAGLSIWLIIHLNYVFLQPAIKNRQRFKLYRLRDELSLLAMQGDLDEESEEYVMLVKIINSAIKATESFRVTDYLRFVWRLQKDIKLIGEINSIISRIKNHEHTEYCRVASQVFYTMRDILRSDTRTLRYLFFPVLILMAGALSLFKITSPKKTVEMKRDQIEEMNKNLDSYSSRFTEVCRVA